VGHEIVLAYSKHTLVDPSTILASARGDLPHPRG